MKTVPFEKTSETAKLVKKVSAQTIIMDIYIYMSLYLCIKERSAFDRVTYQMCLNI